MKTSTLALFSILGSATAQGVTSAIAPSGTAPAGCEPSVSSKFEIAVIDVDSNSKRDVALKKKRDQCSTDGILVATLENSVLTDSKGRTGYIASNYQFQFDDPPQAGAIYTAGFSSCGNSSLALGDSTVFYKCLSGDFYNLYDRSWAAQCSPVEISILPCDDSDPSGGASQDPAGQVVGTEVYTTTVVVPLSDGQPQVVTTTVPVPICQITDGQLQVHTTPCASVTTTVAASTTLVPASQYSDGQIQITPGGTSSGTTAPVTTTLETGSTSSGTAAPATTTLETGGSTVVVPTETMPTATGSASVVGSNSTLLTTASPSASTSSSAAGTSASSSRAASTSAPATGAASRAGLGSVAALIVGIAGALLGL